MKNTKSIFKVLFIIYLLFLGYLLFLAPSFGRNLEVRREYNVVPFRTINNYFKHKDLLPWKIFYVNIIGNIVAFVPMGFLLPALFRKRRLLLHAFLFSIGTSLIVELLQYRFSVGSFDVDDILLNTVGGLLGYLLYKIIYQFYCLIRRRKRND